MATAFIRPDLLVVLLVAHHLTYKYRPIANAAVLHKADEPVAIVTHVEHDAMPDLIG